MFGAKQYMGNIVNLGSFSQLSTREEDIISILDTLSDRVIVNGKQVESIATKDTFGDVVFFVGVLVQHLRLKEQALPRLIYILPDNAETVIERLSLVYDKTGLDIQCANSIKQAKAMFGTNTRWVVLR